VVKLARDIVLHVGDVLHDETLNDVGVLLERYDGTGGTGTVITAGGTIGGVAVWRTWWIRAGAENYSEFGLQNLIHLDVFVRYRAGLCECCDLDDYAI
jgi:hypothetical protein|tara:strand:+ start:799 stop:1092 length:294 start_codon:yes stop_codon:yes gene_type:complete